MSEQPRILVVDDERSMREFLEIFFRREGFEVVTASDAPSALLCLENDEVDVVITDMQMPEGSGLDVLHGAHQLAPDAVVIVITAFATTDSAIEAMKKGAYDYITKPFKVDELRLVVDKALEKKDLFRENERLKSELRSQARCRSIIGSSPAMQPIFDLITQVAGTKTNVLISGESGTGKELVARAIHNQSSRSERSFVAINCGAIPENLLESELFGHVKGAFTGAIQNKEGLFEAAEGGTLFLDEVGELPLALQVKLLRVLQEKTIRRVGGTQDQGVDVRVLSATNRRLEDEIEAGRFREDLYYRLNVIQVELPPLRERLDDLPLLIQHFIEKFSSELEKPIEGFSELALGELFQYGFPGNVRELENIVERAVALTRGETIDVSVLPPTVTSARSRNERLRIPPEGVKLESLVDDYERRLLDEALREARGVKKQAARLLGISFRSFRYRLEKLGLEAG
ncbi:MAG: sigma-54 dependent transcriptional regulator [Myxococcota bacterium]|nr:sigma-54 dependent transcriptional regulator [Myxococcota bacterium]